MRVSIVSTNSKKQAIERRMVSGAGNAMRLPSINGDKEIRHDCIKTAALVVRGMAGQPAAKDIGKQENRA
jgi:hypothetical protein